MRLLAYLGDDFTLLRAAIAAAEPDAQVPTCPDWTVADLAHHVAEVYLHKAECIRLRALPDPWPPPQESGQDLTAALDAAYAALTEQFASHTPTDPAATWYEPDQSVGFWIRRMAQETVIHRADAELAGARPLSPIPGDLAIDGIDEMLKLFTCYGSTRWREGFGDLLDAPDERPISVVTGQAAWAVKATRQGVEATGPSRPAAAAAAVSGDPGALLLWLWNRAGDGAVRCSGDPALLAQFRALRTAASQ